MCVYRRSDLWDFGAKDKNACGALLLPVKRMFLQFAVAIRYSLRACWHYKANSCLTVSYGHTSSGQQTNKQNS